MIKDKRSEWNEIIIESFSGEQDAIYDFSHLNNLISSENMEQLEHRIIGEK